MSNASRPRTNKPSFLRGLMDLLSSRSHKELFRKAIGLWQREGMRGLQRAVFTIGRFQLSYPRWIALYDRLSTRDRKLIRRDSESLERHPFISVVLPVRPTSIGTLGKSIESIRRQIYCQWELHLVTSSSVPPALQALILNFIEKDGRITAPFINHSVATGLPEQLNLLLESTEAELLVLLEPDNELSDHALYLVASEYVRNHDPDCLYGDEDRIDDIGQRSKPYFKPDWNPDLFLAQNYLMNFVAYRTETVRSVGGFRPVASKAYGWDLALRVAEVIEPSRIRHIPFILSHRHYGLFSGRESTETPEDIHAAIRVLEDHWLRQGHRVTVEALDSEHFRTRFPLPEPLPLVSIIVPTRNGLVLLKKCLEGLFKLTDYTNLEIMVVDNNSDDPQTLDYLAELANVGLIRLLEYKAEFNYSAINNMAVSVANGELICLLNNDVEPIHPDWLKEMASHALRPEIGAVGAMLYYPDGTIQHAGVVLNGIVAGHLYTGFPRGHSGENARCRLVQNLSAVTAACLVVRKKIWDEAGGMDEKNLTVAFNDVDFCLKVRQLGYRNLWTPFAELYHHESASRGREDTPEKLARVRGEITCIQQRWGALLFQDPAWNPNLELDGSWPRPAHPPRSEKPWMHSDRPQS